METIETTPAGLYPKGQVSAGFSMILGGVVDRTFTYDVSEGKVTYYLDKEHNISRCPHPFERPHRLLENDTEVKCLPIGCEPNFKHKTYFLF